MLDKLLAVVTASGMWNGTQKQTHAFLLSPSTYEITKEQKDELARLGYALYQCLQGFAHIASIANNPTYNYKGVWVKVRKMLMAGVPHVYSEFSAVNQRSVPELLKVDFMVNHRGEFKIAEIDGHNKHGVGYSTLAKRLRDVIRPNNGEALPGVANLLAHEVRRKKREELNIFFSDKERFYRPEFTVAKQELEAHGISCRVFSEMEAGSGERKGLFLDLPLLDTRPELYASFLEGYKNGTVDFIIPPKPFLGAKNLLAVLRNDENDEAIEGLLKSFIHPSALAIVRPYIPETFLVGKSALHIDDVRTRLADKRYILKESISSGMKGTAFYGEEDFERMLRIASKSTCHWILQEEVENQPQRFWWWEYENNTYGKLVTSDDWFMRVTAQYVHRQLADIIVTARRDKAVHGAKDCLQLGTIVRP